MQIEDAPAERATTLARKRSRALDARAIATLFTEARTARAFLPEPVPHALLARLVDLVESGPTSSNTLPLRLTFVESSRAKERLGTALPASNREKMMSAPVTAIVAADVRFYASAPAGTVADARLARKFEAAEQAQAAREFALTQATLQGAYLHLAARALGLDAGPMGGFDRAVVDREFYPDARCVSIWLVNLGYGDDAKLPPRAARYSFREVALVV